MKIRTGFVSNSSSSSFIVIRSTKDLDIKSRYYSFEKKDNKYTCCDSFHSSKEEYDDILNIFKLSLTNDEDAIILWEVVYDSGFTDVSFLSYNKLLKSIENVDVRFEWLHSPEDESSNSFDDENMRIRFYNKSWKKETDKIMRKIKLLKLNNEITSNNLLDVTNYSKVKNIFNKEEKEIFWIENTDLF